MSTHPHLPDDLDATPPALPRIGEGKRGPEGHVGYLLRQAAAGLRAEMEAALADLALTPPQYVVLTMIDAHPGLSGADVARLAHLTPQTVSLIVGNLERSGAIGRSPHPVHGRVVRLHPTDVGRSLRARARERVEVVERRLVAGLTVEEEAVVRRWLIDVGRRAADRADDREASSSD